MKRIVITLIYLSIGLAAALFISACSMQQMKEQAPVYAISGVKITLALEQLKTRYEPTRAMLINQVDKGVFIDSEALTIRNVVKNADALKVHLTEFSRENGNIERLINIAELEPLFNRAKTAYISAYRILKPKIDDDSLSEQVSQELEQFNRSVEMINTEYKKIKSLPSGSDISPWISSLGDIAQISIDILQLYGSTKRTGSN